MPEPQELFGQCELREGPNDGDMRQCTRLGRFVMYLDPETMETDESFLCAEHEQLVYYCEDCGERKHPGQRCLPVLGNDDEP